MGVVPDGPFYEEDRLWVERAQQDDRQAFDRLVDKYQSWLIGLCRRFLGDENLAEDAAVETFRRAWQNRASFRFGCPFRYWLWRIGRNECLRRQERQYRQDEHEQPMTGLFSEQEEASDRSLPDPSKPLEQQIIDRERIATIRERLSERDRTLFELIYAQDLSSDEAGEYVGLTGSAVRSIVKRTLVPVIRQVWKEMEG